VCIDRFNAREQRLARAQDMSFKHEYLPADIQAVQTPGKVYLAPIMAELKKIREERDEMKIN
jgi:ubiquinol-cytochrome c reductase subunit 7